MATRKETLKWIHATVDESATSDGAGVKLIVEGTARSRTEFNGHVREYALFYLAKQCIVGLNAIHARQVSDAEQTARLIKRLRGGDL